MFTQYVCVVALKMAMVVVGDNSAYFVVEGSPPREVPRAEVTIEPVVGSMVIINGWECFYNGPFNPARYR
jgi:hypothetical protein